MEKNKIHCDLLDGENRAMLSFMIINGIPFSIEKYNKNSFNYAQGKVPKNK